MFVFHAVAFSYLVMSLWLALYVQFQILLETIFVKPIVFECIFFEKHNVTNYADISVRPNTCIYVLSDTLYYRNHYICSVHAAKLMVPRKKGLIINISSFGGISYLFTPAYGVGKAGVSFLFTLLFIFMPHCPTYKARAFYPI